MVHRAHWWLITNDILVCKYVNNVWNDLGLKKGGNFVTSQILWNFFDNCVCRTKNTWFWLKIQKFFYATCSSSFVGILYMLQCSLPRNLRPIWDPKRGENFVGVKTHNIHIQGGPKPPRGGKIEIFFSESLFRYVIYDLAKFQLEIPQVSVCFSFLRFPKKQFLGCCEFWNQAPHIFGCMEKQIYQTM